MYMNPGNPPCACPVSSTDYRCVWCPLAPPSQAPLCQCQLHWILITNTVSPTGPGRGVCIACQRRSVQEDTQGQRLAALTQLLDTLSDIHRYRIDRNLDSGVTRERLRLQRGARERSRSRSGDVPGADDGDEQQGEPEGGGD